jgi:hypothetical protein
MTRRSGFTMIVTGARQRVSNGLVKQLITGRLLNGLNVWNCFQQRLRDERAQSHAYKAEHDGAKESGPKAGDSKTRYEM